MKYKIETRHIKRASRDFPLTYISWKGMFYRCNNKNCDDYRWYGKKGIKVCERWKIFSNFLRDMGARPDKRFTIDRINNDKDYVKSNCRWALKEEQAQHRTNNYLVKCDGEWVSLRAASIFHKICYKRVHSRLSEGWSVKEALTIAPYGRRKNK